MPPPSNRDPRIYGQIVADRRISNGAHRLWCYLANSANSKPVCWPSVRKIRSVLNCHYHSYAKWVLELKKFGYLKTVKDKRSLNYYPALEPPPLPPSSKVKTPDVFKSEDGSSSKVKSECLQNRSRSVFKSEPRTNRKELIIRNYSGAAPKGGNGAPLSEAGKKALEDFKALKKNL